MERIAEFYKVSFEQFKKDYISNIGENKTESELKEIYDNIKLPQRATATSGGYDLYLPFEIDLKPGEEIFIPTGIRYKSDPDYIFMLTPKSGLGSKCRLQLSNTVGIIDSDYFFSSNEGHLQAKIIYDTRTSTENLKLPAGKSFIQGIFLKFGITKSDNAQGTRDGGFGSTK